jgi:hypothetical protein
MKRREYRQLEAVPELVTESYIESAKENLRLPTAVGARRLAVPPSQQQAVPFARFLTRFITPLVFLNGEPVKQASSGRNRVLLRLLGGGGASADT